MINKVGLDIYDVFTNRIMIPIEDLKGQVVGFTGRIYNNETDTAKYMNTRETDIFKKDIFCLITIMPEILFVKKSV